MLRVSLCWALCWVLGIAKETQGKVSAPEQEPCGGEMCEQKGDSMLNITGEACTSALEHRRGQGNCS